MDECLCLRGVWEVPLNRHWQTVYKQTWGEHDHARSFTSTHIIDSLFHDNNGRRGWLRQRLHGLRSPRYYYLVFHRESLLTPDCGVQARILVCLEYARSLFEITCTGRSKFHASLPVGDIGAACFLSWPGCPWRLEDWSLNKKCLTGPYV